MGHPFILVGLVGVHLSSLRTGKAAVGNLGYGRSSTGIIAQVPPYRSRQHDGMLVIQDLRLRLIENKNGDGNIARSGYQMSLRYRAFSAAHLFTALLFRHHGPLYSGQISVLIVRLLHTTTPCKF